MMTQQTGYPATFSDSQYTKLDNATQQFCCVINKVNDEQTMLSTITTSHNALAIANVELMQKVYDLSKQVQEMNAKQSTTKTKMTWKDNGNYCWTHG